MGLKRQLGMSSWTVLPPRGIQRNGEEEDKEQKREGRRTEEGRKARGEKTLFHP